MILLDTNVVSEVLRNQPSAEVNRWLSEQDEYNLFLPATSQAELLFGLAVLPAGKRRHTLEQALEAFLTDVFGDRILPFDTDAARRYASLVASARARGRAVAIADGQIGAVAAAHRFTVATRDIAPFVAMGLPVINPWHPA